MEILGLGNSQNWESLGSYSAQGAPVPNNPNAYQPIPEFSIPLTIDSRIIAVVAESTSAKPTWHFAGFLFQKVHLGIIVGGGFDSDATSARKIYLNRISLLTFRNLTPTYGISFKPPFWFQDVKLTIWKYTGVDTTVELNQLANIQLKLTSIETKIDNL